MAFPLLAAGLFSGGAGGGGGSGGHGSAGPSEASNTGTFGAAGSNIFTNPISIGGFKSDGSAGPTFPMWAVVGFLALAAIVAYKRFIK